MIYSTKYKENTRCLIEIIFICGHAMQWTGFITGISCRLARTLKVLKEWPRDYLNRFKDKTETTNLTNSIGSASCLYDQLQGKLIKLAGSRGNKHVEIVDTLLQAYTLTPWIHANPTITGPNMNWKYSQSKRIIASSELHYSKTCLRLPVGTMENEIKVEYGEILGPRTWQ